LLQVKARREGGREVYLQLRLLKRTVLVARAQTALYLAAGLFPLSLESGADPVDFRFRGGKRCGFLASRCLQTCEPAPEARCGVFAPHGSGCVSFPADSPQIIKHPAHGDKSSKQLLLTNHPL